MRPLLLLLLFPLSGISEAVRAHDLTGMELTSARKLYVAKCAKCHRFYEPTAYGETEWRTWMEKMRKKSKLKPEQDHLLNRYLDAYRAGQLPGKPETK